MVLGVMVKFNDRYFDELMNSAGVKAMTRRAAEKTLDRSVGVTVRYGARAAPKPCRDLASRIYGLLTDPDICSLDGSPIVAIEEDGCNGPYFVAEDANIARSYLTVEFSAIGEFR